MKGTVEKILILGTGRFAPVAADIISEVPGLQVCGYIENMHPGRCDEPLGGLPVYWIDEAGSLADEHRAICCLGTTRRQGFIQQAAERGFTFISVVHPTSRISGRSAVAPGCLVGPGVMVSSNTKLRAHVRVNRGVLIGHDTEIGAYTTIQPGANIAGGCRLGQGCYVGMSATILDSLTIGSGCVIGAGAVVTKDLPDRVMAVGVPARIIRENIENK